jgi:hypothetical protein
MTMQGPKIEIRRGTGNTAGTRTAAQRFNDDVLLTFGDPNGNDSDLYYDGTDMQLDVNSGDLHVTIAGGDMAFQQATVISTSSGNLTLSADAGADVLIGDGTTMIHVDGTTNTLAFLGNTPDARMQYNMSVLDVEMGTSAWGEYSLYSWKETGGSTSQIARGKSLRASVASANTQNWTSALGLRGLDVAVAVASSSSETVTGAAALYIGAITTSGATITTGYGIYMEASTAASTDYGLYFNGTNGTADIYNTSAMTIKTGGGALTLDPTTEVVFKKDLSFDFAADINVISANAAALQIRDASFGWMTMNTVLNANGSGITWDSPTISYASAAATNYHVMTIAGHTETWTGGTDITTPIDGVGLQVLPSTLTSTSSTTIAQASTLYVKAPAQGGSVTITSALAAEFDGDVAIANGSGLVVGHTAKITFGSTSELQVLGVSGGDSSLLLARFSANASAPALIFGKSNSGTLGTLAVTQNDDNLAGIYTYGVGTNSAVSQLASFISTFQDGAAGAARVPTRITFGTGTGGQTASEQMRITSSGSVLIGDTSNANNVTGLTVNDGASGIDQTFTLRSGAVCHGMTDLNLAPYDLFDEDFYSIGKISDSVGGVYITAIAESSYANPYMLEVWGGAPATTDTTGSLGYINHFVGQHDNSNADADMAADSNLQVWGEINSSGARLTRMILKADDGELHLDNTTLVAFDDEDDIMLVRAMQRAGAASGIIDNEYDNPFYDYRKLRELGLAGEMDAEGGFLFPLQSRLHAHEGAMWQMYTEMMGMKDKLELAEQKLAAIGA